jgi:hypothetical protein
VNRTCPPTCESKASGISPSLHGIYFIENEKNTKRKRKRKGKKEEDEIADHVIMVILSS